MTMLLFAALSFVACNNEAGTENAETDGLSQDTEMTSDNATAVNLNEDGEAAAPVGPTTSISFDETSFDFGDAKEGEKVKHAYKFTNTGSEPLVISNAKGSCGCTVPEWPKNPIPPGETGEIMVEFNSKGKPGKQTKRVTITANTDPAQTFLQISGNVIKAETSGEEG